MSFTLAGRKATLEQKLQTLLREQERLRELAQPHDTESWAIITKMAEDRCEKLRESLLSMTDASLESIRLVQGEATAWRKILALPETLKANMTDIAERIQETRSQLEDMP